MKIQTPSNPWLNIVTEEPLIPCSKSLVLVSSTLLICWREVPSLLRQRVPSMCITVSRYSSPCKGELFNLAFCYHWFMSIPTPWVIPWQNLAHSLFLNEVFGTQTATPSITWSSCFCTITENLVLTEIGMTHKTKIFVFWPFYRKSLLNIASWLEHGKAKFLGLNLLHFLYPVPEISPCQLFSGQIILHMASAHISITFSCQATAVLK